MSLRLGLRIMNKSFDCIIIGYGPCGISCAIYLKRYGYNPLVIGKDYGALEKAHIIENYYGINSKSGIELVLSGIEQAKNLGIDIITDEVLEIDPFNGYKVICKNNQYFGKSIMLAVGANRNRFSLASKFEGNGVSYCATCDGFFYRKKKIGIVGNSSYMLHELEVLKNMNPNITLFTNGLDLDVEVNDIKIVKDKITALVGEEYLSKVVCGNDEYEIDGLFIAMGSASGFSIAKHIGLALENNSIIVDKEMKTNIPGIYAGGDAIGGLLQVSKAVSDGAIAATSISKFLKKSIN